ncbi:MAG TPA: hypothetical protein VH560_08900 [Polyangia bacterium]|jgi:hypothetical protein|nr:hypothetical protein [Polyangia bacterium]
MRPSKRLASRALVPLLWAWSAASARAQEAESIDDPKVERRLGTRVDYATTSPVGDALAPADAAPVAVIGAQAGSPAELVRRVPRLMLGYRRFTFAHIGATSSSGPGADEPFDVVSLDFFPVSNTFRFGMSTQYGWQEGTFRQNGDVILAETLSLGVQAAGPVATPFVDGYAGAGLMQRTNAGLNTIATLYDELGIDAGVDFFLAPHFFLSASLAYLHAQNWFAKSNLLGDFSVDTWSFKLGMGL